MARKIINRGSSANDGRGDSLRQAAEKINENFAELYSRDSGGGLADAPSDGSAYVRKDGSWSTLASEGTLSDAPNDGNNYLRRSGTWASVPNNLEAPSGGSAYGRSDGIWVEVVPEAPDDATAYVRLGASWSELPNIISDAPADGDLYARKDSAWVSFTSISDAPNDGQTYARSSGSWIDITSELFGSLDLVDSSDVISIIDALGLEGLDSADILSVVDSAYVQSRQIIYTFDSSNVTSVVDSAYVQGLQIISTYDSATTVSIVDSDYVQARQITYTFDPTDVIGVVDSDYVQARQIISAYDSSTTVSIVDSDYVQARQIISTAPIDSAGVISLIDSDYVALRAPASGPASGVDSDVIISLIDSDYVQARQSATTPGTGGLDSASVISLIDSAYINTRVDSIGGGGGSVASINDVGDVTITSPSSNDVLRWNFFSSNWTNSPNTLENLGGVSIFGTPSNGDVLTYSTSSGFWEASAPSGGSSGGGIDSSAVITLIDSDYVQARQSSTAPGSGGVDSATVFTLIDSDYVAARVPETEGGSTGPSTTFNDLTRGVLTKTFTSGETADITLNPPLQANQIASVTVGKEGSRSGLLDNSLKPNGSNFQFRNSAYATGLSIDNPGHDPDVMSYNTVSQDFSGVVGGIKNIRFADGGSRLYILGTDNVVYQYSVGTAYDITTATYDLKSFDVTSSGPVPTDIKGLAFNDDGTQMYIGEVWSSFGRANQYNLSTAWDVSSASYSFTSGNFLASFPSKSIDGMFFTEDGFGVYLIDEDLKEIRYYTSSTAFSITGYNVLNSSFSYDPQTTGVVDIHASSLGNRLVLLSQDSDKVHLYNMSAGSLSGISYSGKSFVTTSQAVNPAAFEFNDKGTLMVVADSSGVVYEYYAGDSAEQFLLDSGGFSEEDTHKRIEIGGGVAYLTDSTGSFEEIVTITDRSTASSGSWEMYDLQYRDDSAIQVSGFVGEPFDIENPVYTGKSYDMEPEDFSIQDIHFSANGTKAYSVGLSGDTVNEYTLSTAWDISTATVETEFSIVAQESTPTSVHLSADGTKLYYSGTNSDKVHRHNLSTPFDLSTASAVVQDLSITRCSAVSIFFKSDGTKLYVGGNDASISDGCVLEFDLSTPWDLSTATFVFKLDVSANGGVYSVEFSLDGTIMTILHDSERINKYELSTPWDLSTATDTLVESPLFNSQENDPRGHALSPDGTALYITGQFSDTTYQYRIADISSYYSDYAVAISDVEESVNWSDINSVTTENSGVVFYAFSHDGRATWKVSKSGENERRIVRDNAGTWEYNSENTVTGFSFDQVSLVEEISFTSQDAAMEDIFIAESDGKFYKLGRADTLVYQYSFDGSTLASATYDSASFDPTSENTSPQGIALSSSGDRLYIMGGDDLIRQYDLGTNWDISTASYDSDGSSSYDFIHDSFPLKIRFSNTGQKAFVYGASADRIYELDLSVPWDISTATYSSNFMNTSSDISSARAFTISKDGTVIAVSSYTELALYELSSAWDVTTASFVKKVNAAEINGGLNRHEGLDFTSDGFNLFVINDQFSNDLTLSYQTTTTAYTDSEVWTPATENDEFEALSNAMSIDANRMSSEQINALSDSAFIVDSDFSFAVIMTSDSDVIGPIYENTTIDFDGLGYGVAVPGTDYDWTEVNNEIVRIESLSNQTLKIRVL